MARTASPFAPQVPAPGPVGGAFSGATLNVSPDMFGAGTARAAGDLGQALQQAGQAITQQIIQDKIIENETEATNANNAYTEEASRLWSEFSNLQGQEAVDALPRFQEQIRSLRDRYTSGASNPAVRRQINRSIGGSAAVMLGQAAQQNGRNVRVAGDNAATSQGNLMINEGVRVRDNPQEVAGALSRGLEAVEQRARINGWDDATTGSARAEYRGRFYSAVIATVAENDPLRAQQVFEANRDSIDAQSQIRIQNFLEAPVRTRRAADIVQEVTRIPGAPPPPGAPAAPGTPTNRQAGTPGDVREQAWRAEGGAAQNPNPGQTARGGGITDGTWASYAQRLGLTPEQRGTREAFNRVWDAYQSDAQRDIGRVLTPNEQYTAWFLGIAGARAFIQADPNADAYQTYRGVAGPNIADQAFRSNGAIMRPGMTVAQVLQNVGNHFQRYGGGGNPEGVQQRGRDEQLRVALDRAGNDPQLRQAVLSQLRQQWGVDDAMNAAERDRMGLRVEALLRALAAGTNVAIPESDIRRIYQPEQAAHIIDQLRTQQVVGDVRNSVALATPAEIGQMQQDIAEGRGPVVSMLRERRGTRIGGDGLVVEEDRAGDVVARQAIGATFAEAVRARGEALRADPAQYVQADPAVRAATQAQREAPNDPALMTAYANATLAAQARLGVAEQDRRILSTTNAAGLAAQIARADPGTQEGAMGTQLNGLRRLYGEQWPRVFGELVRDGLPAEFQVLANIPSDAARADYQRALYGVRQRGGIQQYTQAVPDRERQAIDRDIDKRLEAFRSSVFAGQQIGAADVFATYRDGVRLLSMYYALNGMDGAAAVRTATDRILNDKYEFSGTARVPRVLNDGTVVGMSNAQRAIRATMQGMRINDLVAPESRDPALSEDVRRQNMYSVAQRGVWVPNADDSGLVLMGQWEGGARIPVRRRDGSIYELRFSDMAQIGAGAINATIPGMNPRRGNPGQSGAAALNQQYREEDALLDLSPDQQTPRATSGGNVAPDAVPRRGAVQAPTRTPAASSVPVGALPPVPGTSDGRVRDRGQPPRGRWVAPGVQ